MVVMMWTFSKLPMRQIRLATKARARMVLSKLPMRQIRELRKAKGLTQDF